MHITVVGAGYVGLVQAVGLASINHHVSLIVRNPKTRERLEEGCVPIHEKSLRYLLETNRKNIRFVASPKDELSPTLVLLCVGTLVQEGSKGLAALETAADEIAPHLEEQCVVAVKSTVPVGTCRRIQERLREATGKKIDVVSNPEFLREGSAFEDFFNPSRVVVGGDDPGALSTVQSAWEPLGAPVVRTGMESAEMIKMASNHLLAARVAQWNEIASVCEATGANAIEVARGVEMDPNIGKYGLKAGPGIGGSCFPKDVAAFAEMAEAAGVHSYYATAFPEANQAHIDRMVSKAKALYWNPKPAGESHIAILGLAYKAGTGDIRNSPALEIVRVFRNAGANLWFWDPGVATSVAMKAMVGELDMWFDTPYEAMNGADLAIIATEWPELADLDPRKVAAVMPKPSILDLRNVLYRRAPKFIDAGIEYQCVGTTCFG